MNTVAPPFVSRDNILSSSSVQWTVSWICLTSRISISVNTSDNLDNCHQATRTSMKGGEKAECFVVQYGFTETLWKFGTCQEFEGAYFQMLKHILLFKLISLLSHTHTFIHTETDFCLLWIGRQPGLLNGIVPNEYVNEIWLMHLELFDLSRILYIQYNYIVCWFSLSC